MPKDERFYKAYMEHRQASRRQLLFGAFKSAQEKIVEERRAVRVARPPGAQEEILFRHFCTKCSQCISACPMGVLVKDEEGYPRLEIEYASCDGCGQCIQQCSPKALIVQARFDTQLRPVITGKCLNVSSDCNICISYCPQQAMVQTKKSPPHILENSCNGCGECFIACSDKAITLKLIG